MPWNPDTERDPESAPESAPEGAVAEDSGPSDKSPDSERDNFDDAPVRSANDDELVLDLDGFEGPIDILLTLARDQKVDLRKISILELADQYLAFIARARRLRLEIAADYLVMAAWLAYLKSRLLLPEPPADGEPSGADLAAALAFQLQRLEAMQEAGKNMMALPQFGRDFFARGAPEPVKVIDIPVWDVTLFDLLKAYGTHPGRRREGMLRIAPLNLFSMDDALKRIGDMLGHVLDWTVLKAFLPEGMETPLQRRSALAATFAATLELARSGNIELRQEGVFSPIYLRRAIRRDEPDATELQQG